MCKGCCKKGACITSMIAKILVVVGGLNWGLVGIGMFLGGDSWNLVNMIFGSMPILEAVVYLLVAVSAIVMLFDCKCGKCIEGVCAPCEPKTESKAEGTM